MVRVKVYIIHLKTYFFVFKAAFPLNIFEGIWFLVVGVMVPVGAKDEVNASEYMIVDLAPAPPSLTCAIEMKSST